MANNATDLGVGKQKDSSTIQASPAGTLKGLEPAKFGFPRSKEITKIKKNERHRTTK